MSKRALLRLAKSFCFTLCVILLGHTNVFADEVTPIHEYNFESDSGTTVVDSVKENAIDGTTTSQKFVLGYNGRGYAKHFDGASKDIIKFTEGLLPKGAKSIRFKFRKEASTISENDEVFFSSYDSENVVGCFMRIIGKHGNSAGGGYLSTFSKNDSSLLATVYICDGRWHDILYTWDGTSTAKLYIDDMTTPYSTQEVLNEIVFKNVVVGVRYPEANAANNYAYFTGDLDDIQIYDSVITAEATNPVISSNLKASGGNSKIDLTWDAVEKATNYTVKRSTTAGGPYTSVATDLTETSYTDTGVTNGTTYYYVVTATNNGTEITNSNEASAQPVESQIPPTTEAKLKVVLEVSEALRLSVDDDLNVNTQMSWSSSDPTVATVNEKGIVTALAPGNTIITVKSVDGSYTDYINVLVVENADDYRLAIDLKVGETARLTADDFTNTANITWAPMDSSIANVTSKGKVTALSKGLVLISAKDTEGNIIGRVYVRVRE